jgi:hypothetical protein
MRTPQGTDWHVVTEAYLRRRLRAMVDISKVDAVVEIALQRATHAYRSGYADGFAAGGNKCFSENRGKRG